MSEVWIRWDQRAFGREVGEVEEVEKTEFVENIIEQGRVTVVDAPKEEKPEAPVAPPALLGVVVPGPEEAPKPKATKKADDSKEE